jgi:hypothetical protein
MIRNATRKPGPERGPAEPPAAAQGETDLGALFRTGLWGGTAALCLLAVALASRTETGQSRLAAAYGTPTEAASRPPAAPEGEIKARQMSETIRNLTEDRDRLLARMTALERNYEDVTGSIGRLANAAKPPAGPAAVPAPPPAAEPAPAVAAAQATVAAAPPVVAAPEAAEPVATRTEFGVDIGGGPTLASLRAAWDRIRRNHASLLDGLRPVIAVRDGRGGQVDLRLIVGPIGNAAAAAKLCASLAAAGLSCQPTMFDGQRLALR